MSAKIPILLMARELHIGGSERQMTETAKGLDRSLFEPHVGCFRPAGVRGDELRDHGVIVTQWPVMSYRSMGAVRGARDIARYIHRHRIAIVHTWDYAVGVYAIPIARLATQALAVASQRSERILIPAGYRRVLPAIDRLSHAIVVNSKFVERQLISQGIAREKLKFCPNGIDLERFRRTPADHPLTVGVVCALRPEKNLGVLIDAFALARNTSKDVRLRIVGSGPELEKLRARAVEKGVAEMCSFEPATADVPERLSAIDIFVLPSRSEAFSNSLMEAMACGCCAIASDTGGNPELIRHGETGLLFPNEDATALAEALRRVIADGELRCRLAASGCLFIHGNFSNADAARRMQEIYLRLMEDFSMPSLGRSA
ncbi:MAG: glycosyltransferase [Acidobacteriia bacterium]|nr:glycosyltransferase [Terriglobia bacterium]